MEKQWSSLSKRVVAHQHKDQLQFLLTSSSPAYVLMKTKRSQSHSALGPQIIKTPLSHALHLLQCGSPSITVSD